MKAPAKSSASSSPAPSRASAKKEEATALFALLEEHEHEQVSLVYEPSSGYRGIIAIHDTTLGPRWAARGSGITPMIATR